MLTVANGGLPIVSEPVWGLTTTVIGPVLDCVGLLESVAFTMTVEDPVTVGVPVMVQLVPSVRPTGRVPPARVQVYGAVPPATGSAPV